jgi:antitoxin component YwqK of YwqJK toxin-antitoxin module
MKFRILFFICIIISSVDIASAQNLVTKKTYWDWGNSRLHESFTVIAGTGTRHGSYKEYDRNGLISANYNHGALHGLCIEYFGTSEKYISKSTNYLNGKKSGVEKNYNLGSSGHYLLEECIYKEDEMIEKTSYYTDAKISR